jgi:5-methyltetrahydrofolate--homocysteine methyltransferase
MISMESFLEALTTRKVLIADGATGTELQKAGLPSGMPPEKWNLINPDAIDALHRSYLDAGSDIILTNTFGGSPIKLAMNSLDSDATRINQRAAEIARKAAEKYHAFVFGDVGPSGKLLEPMGDLTIDSLYHAYQIQIRALTEGGVDAILIETMSDLEEAKTAVRAAKSVTSLPVIVTFSFDSHGRTMMGLKPSTAATELSQLEISVIGANCGRTLSETLSAIQEIKTASPGKTWMAKPNAGLPHLDSDYSVYDVSPEIMAEFSQRFLEEGVKIFGGCCGSAPAHIAAISRVLK